MEIITKKIMNPKIKEILLCLLLLFSFSAIKAQEKTDLLVLPIVDDEWECALTDTPLVEIIVSVWSNKMGELKNLTYKDFEVYDEKELRQIEFFKFDELKNQYTIGFFQDENIPDNEWRNLKVNIKLSEKIKKDYGEISVKAQKGYYSGNLKPKI